MTTQLTFEITLNSDFHISSGNRKGTEIDSALLRECDGRPALRGSLTGQLMREAARDLLQAPVMFREAYQHHNSTDVLPHDKCPLCWIFGNPGRPRQWEFSSAWLKEAKRPGLESISVHQEWAAHPVSRVRIDPQTRRAADNQLFVEEVGDCRFVFQFHATWNGIGKADDGEIAFLAAAARNLRHLGKSRRRGRGACQVKLVAIDGQKVNSDDWLNKFEEAWIDDTWQPTISKSQPQLILEENIFETTGPEYRVRVIARLEEPLILAKRSAAGNQFDTQIVLPGNVLSGALAARANFNDPDRYSQLIHLFRRGLVKFSFLFPAEGLPNEPWLYAAFPAPLDVFRCKQHPTDNFSNSHHDQAFSLKNSISIQCSECPENGDNAVESLKGENAWQTLSTGRLSSFSVKRREEMHIRLNPETQRVRTGDLFSYVAIEAGQFLIGEIICKNKSVWDALSQETDLPQSQEPVKLRLGKAIRRGYGLVSVVFQPNSENLIPPLRDRLPDPKKPFRLLLLTDAIIVDQWGRFPASFSEDWLAYELGLPASEKQKGVKLIRGFSRVRKVDGFNNQIGLPRWRDGALAAGSVAGVQIDDQDLDDKKIYEALEAAELNGIGLRRNEGYGQIVINHPLYEKLVKDSPQNCLQFETPIYLKGLADPVANPVIGEAEFRYEWERKLGNDWNDFEYPEFIAIARILRSRNKDTSENILKILKDYGNPDLHRLPGKRMLVNDPENKYSRRTKKSVFLESKGKPGIERIQRIIDTLNQFAKTEQQRSLGLMMLADRIADAVQRSRRREK